MGQIQNAILNSLGSIQQMTQMYKFTDAYIKRQEDKAAEARQRDLERDVKTGKLQMAHQQTRGKLVADIRQGGFTEDQKKRYEKEYGHLSGLTGTEIGTVKGQLTNLIKKTQQITLDPNDPELTELYLKSEYLDETYPNKEEQKKAERQANKDKKEKAQRQTDKKAKAQKSAQEQANTNENIEKARDTIKGGNQ